MGVSLPESESWHGIQESISRSDVVSSGDDDGFLQSFNSEDYQTAGQFCLYVAIAATIKVPVSIVVYHQSCKASVGGGGSSYDDFYGRQSVV